MKKWLSILAITTFTSISVPSVSMVLNTSLNYKENSKVTNFYVLGDSLSDNGAGVGLANAHLKLYPDPHYDSYAMGKYFYNNSASNGPVAAEVLANKLGFKLNPAWNFNLEGKIFNHIGNNYAIAGETAGDYFPGQQSPGTINCQIKSLLLQHQLQSNDIIFFEIGGNDLFFAAQSQAFTPQWIINEALKKEKQGLNTLISAGAKKIIVTNVPDESLLPYLTPEQAKKALEVVIKYNNLWNKMIDEINLKNNNIIKKYDLFSFMRKSYLKFQNLKYNVSNPAFSQDSKIINKVLTEYAIYNKGVSDKNVDKYYFFDNIHPTRVIHDWWGNDIYDNLKL